MRRYIAAAVVAALASLTAAGLLIGGSGESQQRAAAGGYVALADAIVPGATFHSVVETYRRVGDQEPAFRELDSYLPERSRTETWIEFDSGGNISNWLTEVRGSEDGSLYMSSELEGRDLVARNGDGVELHRSRDALGKWTVESVKRRLEEYALRTTDLLTADRNPKLGVTDSQPARVFEESRAVPQPPRIGDGTIGENDFAISLPAVSDLVLEELLKRRFISEGEVRELRLEVVGVDAAGAETVLESHDYLVWEVLAP